MWGAGLDGAVYAQPLVLGDAVFVATEDDSVYAIDRANGNVLWRTHVASPVAQSQLPCGNIDPSGITSTGAIDRRRGLIYVVLFTHDARGFRHELVALEVRSGRVAFRVSADAPGANARVQQQRGALLEAGGRIYIPYGGLFGDCGNYHGWVVSLSATNGAARRVYRVPAHRGAGIWTPGGVVEASSRRLLVATGNSASASRFDFANSVISLSLGLERNGFFAPRNWASLSATDMDLGSVSPAPLGQGLVFQIGKQGVGYLLSLTHLGGIGHPLFARHVCRGGAFGSAAVYHGRIFVPCSDGLYALARSGHAFTVRWRRAGFFAGPPIVVGGTVWTIDKSSGTLLGFSLSGVRSASAPIGAATGFPTPVAADDELFIPAGSSVIAFSE